MGEKQNNFTRRDFLIIGTILAIALTLRLYRINIPLADFHSWRQADTAAVAKNLVGNGFDLLHPKYDDLSNIQSGKENPNGYRMVEFPLYNATFAYFYKVLPILPLEVYGRIVSIFFSLIIIALIYYFLLKEHGRSAATAGALVYASFPFFVFFSRVVLPETTALSCAMLSIFFLYLYTRDGKSVKNRLFYLFSILFFAVSLLIKPTTIFYLVPAIYLFSAKFRWKLLKKPEFYLYFLLIAAPLLLWRHYILQYPEGIPASNWLITSVNTSEGLQNIFFKPAFFRWIFFERINNIILGGFLTVFAYLGLVMKNKKHLLTSFAVATLLYLLVFQGGNIQHEYYQTLILPILAMLVGTGVSFFVKNSRLFISPIISCFIIVFIFVFSYLVSYNRVKDYYNYSTELVSIAKIIDDLTGRDDKIVTDRTGDTTLLYLAKRRGAPAIYKDPDELRREDYKYLVMFDGNGINSVKKQKKYSVLFENDKVTIFRLL